MNNVDFTIPYTDKKYDYKELEKRSIIAPIYTRKNGFDNNPDIAALPCRPDGRDLLAISHRRLAGYDPALAANLPLYDKKAQIAKLNSVVYLLNIVFRFSEAIYGCLLSSYAERCNRITESIKPIKDSDDTMRVISSKKKVSNRAAGFVCIGPTGCGKSVGANLVISMYPDVIRHSFPGYDYIQIPIIKITAFVGNLTQIYISIARVIDDRLDTGDDHVDMVRNKNAGQSAEIVKKWVKIYHIGLLIVDEIQFVRFDCGAGSFENIVGIAEDTGVAIGVIGNPDAYAKLYKVPRILSRVSQNQIMPDEFTRNDTTTFNRALHDILQYQWTNNRYVITRDILEAVKTEAVGNIALLKALVAKIQYEAVCAEARGEDVEITPDYIHKIGDKYFLEIKNYLALPECNDYKRDIEIAKAMNAIFSNVNKDAVDSWMQTQNDLIIDNQDTESQTLIASACEDDMINDIAKATGYTKSQVKRAKKLAFDQKPSLRFATDEDARQAIVAQLAQTRRRNKKSDKAYQNDTKIQMIEDEIKSVVNDFVMKEKII